MSKNTDKISVIDNVPFTGNDVLHRLTSLKAQELRIDIERFNGEKTFPVYSSFLSETRPVITGNNTLKKTLQ